MLVAVEELAFFCLQNGVVGVVKNTAVIEPDEARIMELTDQQNNVLQSAVLTEARHQEHDTSDLHTCGVLDHHNSMSMVPPAEVVTMIGGNQESSDMDNLFNVTSHKSKTTATSTSLSAPVTSASSYVETKRLGTSIIEPLAQNVDNDNSDDSMLRGGSLCVVSAVSVVRDNCSDFFSSGCSLIWMCVL